MAIWLLFAGNVLASQSGSVVLRDPKTGDTRTFRCTKGSTTVAPDDMRFLMPYTDEEKILRDFEVYEAMRAGNLGKVAALVLQHKCGFR